MNVEIGKPYMWKSLNYGNVAVHVTGFSPNGAVAVLSIDGGEASKQAQRFPELSDGIYFAPIEGDHLSKRVARKAAGPKRAVGVNAVLQAATVPVKPVRLTRKPAPQEVTF